MTLKQMSDAPPAAVQTSQTDILNNVVLTPAEK